MLPREAEDVEDGKVESQLKVGLKEVRFLKKPANGRKRGGKFSGCRDLGNWTWRCQMIPLQGVNSPSF